MEKTQEQKEIEIRNLLREIALAWDRLDVELSRDYPPEQWGWKLQEAVKEMNRLASIAAEVKS